jgi:hypothetical protein
MVQKVQERKMVLKSIIGAAMLLTLSAPLYAVPTVHGNLSSEPATNVTSEINPVTGRQYSRFDAFDLSYADTVAAVAAGGVFNGWSIATAAIADDFINSALGLATPSACTGSTTNITLCGSITGWNDGDFGASFDGALDYFAYLSDPLDATSIGLVEFADAGGGVTDITMWAPGVAGLDALVLGNNPVNLLLWTDDPNANPLSQPVPEPGILALLSLGLLGMGVRRFKAKG